MKKYLFITIILCILSIIVWIFIETNSDNFKTDFPIRHVIIEGQYWQTPQASIEKIIAPYTERGYFFANLFSLQRKLQNELPWIQTASISRQWPDKIVVNLSQKTAVAVLNNQALVTQSGDIFFPPLDSFPPDLPALIGGKNKVNDMLKQYQVFTSLANSVNLSIVQVDLSPEGCWTVKLNNKIVVMLGEEDILTRFERFVKVYQQVFIPQHREPSYVDMRYSHGMAVNWKS